MGLAITLPILVFLCIFVLHSRVNTYQTWPCDLDLWPWKSWTAIKALFCSVVMRVFVLCLYTKFEVHRPSRFGRYCTFCTYCTFIVWALSINRPRYLDLWPFDLYIGSLVTCMMYFRPANFGLSRPFRSRVRSRHATNRHTDGRTDRRTPEPILECPSITGAEHNNAPSDTWKMKHTKPHPYFSNNISYL